MVYRAPSAPGTLLASMRDPTGRTIYMRDVMVKQITGLWLLYCGAVT